MELIKTGMAGTVESGDILVEVEKAEAGVDIQLDSTVMGLYGRRIREVITETVAECGVDGIKIVASDHPRPYQDRHPACLRQSGFRLGRQVREGNRHA